MIEISPNQLMLNVETVDGEGRRARLWDYRQQSHVVLAHRPGEAVPATGWVPKEVLENKSHWDWLGARLLRTVDPAADLAEGVYVVDRYGRLIRFHPGPGWPLQEIEQDLIYYEAHYC